MLLFFWRTIQLLHINFVADVVGISLRGTSLESPFHSISPLLEAILRYFEAHFGLCSCIFEGLFHLFVQLIFALFWHSMGKEKFYSIYLSAGGYFAGFFWPVVGIFHHALRKIRHYVVVSLL